MSPFNYRYRIVVFNILCIIICTAKHILVDKLGQNKYFKIIREHFVK